MAQGQYSGIGTPTWDLYQVCCNIRDQWLGSHDHQHHAYIPDYGPWLYKKSDISGVVEVMWCHYHSSMPIWWCWNIYLGPIPSVLQHQGPIVGLMWPSTPCTTPIARVPGPWGSKNLVNLGGWRYVLPLSWLKVNIMVLEQPSLTYTKCVAASGTNRWAHMTLNAMHTTPLTMGLGYANNPIYLGWLKLCGAIAMAHRFTPKTSRNR